MTDKTKLNVKRGQAEGSSEKPKKEKAKKLNRRELQGKMMEGLLNVVLISKPKGLNVPSILILMGSGRGQEALAVIQKWVEEQENPAPEKKEEKKEEPAKK